MSKQAKNYLLYAIVICYPLIMGAWGYYMAGYQGIACVIIGGFVGWNLKKWADRFKEVKS